MYAFDPCARHGRKLSGFLLERRQRPVRVLSILRPRWSLPSLFPPAMFPHAIPHAGAGEGCAEPVRHVGQDVFSASHAFHSEII